MPSLLKVTKSYFKERKVLGYLHLYNRILLNWKGCCMRQIKWLKKIKHLAQRGLLWNMITGISIFESNHVWVKRWEYRAEFNLVIFVAIAREMTKSTDYWSFLEGVVYNNHGKEERRHIHSELYHPCARRDWFFCVERHAAHRDCATPAEASGKSNPCRLEDVYQYEIPL